jgi:transcriptional regulator with XRE-family HTH domain
MKKPPTHPLKIWRESQVPPLSQLKTGSKLNKSGMAVGRWEEGAMPDFDTLIRIEKLTGLTAADFHQHRVILARRKQQEQKKNGRKIETTRGAEKAGQA